ncbi:YaaC family protein, partial [Escherichia coli]|nr:YaaC family protein [Escherichia coli]
RGCNPAYSKSIHTWLRFGEIMRGSLRAMHRLSELCRYDPLKLRQLLNEKENWIIAEFIQQSPSQFIDAISSEITGHQFLIPNVRSAS